METDKITNTPETDQKAVPHIGFYSCATVPAEFARKLERERDEAREALNSREAFVIAQQSVITDLILEGNQALDKINYLNNTLQTKDKTTMPNHCSNTLMRLDGLPIGKLFNKFLKKDNKSDETDKETLDSNKIIPIPKGIRKTMKFSTIEWFQGNSGKNGKEERDKQIIKQI